MKRAIANVAFWTLFSAVCAMWLTATACPDDDMVCLLRGE